MDNATPETNPGHAPEGQQPPAGGKPGKKPPSPEQARLSAERKRLKRRLEKLLADGDADALAEAARKLEGGAGAAEVKEEPAALAKSDEAAPAEKPAAAAPTEEETAAMVPVAQSLVAMVAAPLAGTRYDPMQPRPNPLDPKGEPIVPATQLTLALAPVLAKYLPTVVTTPEGQLAMVAMMWLGPPTAALVMEKLGGGDSGTAGAEGAGVRAG